MPDLLLAAGFAVMAWVYRRAWRRECERVDRLTDQVLDLTRELHGVYRAVLDNAEELTNDDA